MQTISVLLASLLCVGSALHGQTVPASKLMDPKENLRSLKGLSISILANGSASNFESELHQQLAAALAKHSITELPKGAYPALTLEIVQTSTFAPTRFGSNELIAYYAQLTIRQLLPVQSKLLAVTIYDDGREMIGGALAIQTSYRETADGLLTTLFGQMDGTGDRPASSTSSPYVGTWQASYQCGDSIVHSTWEISQGEDGTLAAVEQAPFSEKPISYHQAGELLSFRTHDLGGYGIDLEKEPQRMVLDATLFRHPRKCTNLQMFKRR